MNNQLMTLNDYKRHFVDDLTVELTREARVPRYAYATFDVPKKHQYLMIDIVYFPIDRLQFRYLLVALDVCSNNLDAEEMKVRDANTTLLAFKNILKRRFITLPYTFVMSDSGNEFKGVFNTYLEQKKIIHRTERLGRHTQLSPLNSRIALLSKYLNMSMTNVELRTGNVDKEWRKHLKILIGILNKPQYIKAEKPDIPVINPDTPPVKTYRGMKIYDGGECVRVMLDHATNPVDERKMHGAFRKGDLRYSRRIYRIERIILNVGQVPLYKVIGIDDCVYNEKQLLPATEEEYEEQENKPTELGDDEYEVERITGHIGDLNNLRKMKFIVRWRGYEKETTEPYSILENNIVLQNYIRELKNSERNKKSKK